jgi:hypothetical protein
MPSKSWSRRLCKTVAANEKKEKEKLLRRKMGSEISGNTSPISANRKRAFTVEIC